MELPLTSEQEAQLVRLALHSGKRPEQLLVETAEFLFENEQAFRIAVRQGLAEADAGLFIEEEEMDARVEKMIRS